MRSVVEVDYAAAVLFRGDLLHAVYERLANGSLVLAGTTTVVLFLDAFVSVVRPV
jgi:hypothetical protein